MKSTARIAFEVPGVGELAISIAMKNTYPILSASVDVNFGTRGTVRSLLIAFSDNFDNTDRFISRTNGNIIAIIHCIDNGIFPNIIFNAII